MALMVPGGVRLRQRPLILDERHLATLIRITQGVNRLKRKRVIVPSALLAFFGLFALQPGQALAECDATTGPQDSALIAELDSGSQATRSWAESWGLVWSLASAGQALAAMASHGSEKTDLWIGAGSSALGLIPTWISPPAITHFPSDRSSLCDSRDFEKILERYAQDDRRNSGWIAQAGNLGVNAGVGLILGLGYGHWSSAGISMAIGIPVGEAMILTYPNAAGRLQAPLERTRVSFAPTTGGGSLLVSMGI